MIGLLEKNCTISAIRNPVATFLNLAKGEYTVEAFVTDLRGRKLEDPNLNTQVTRVGIGDIIVAIGDSLTEG